MNLGINSTVDELKQSGFKEWFEVGDGIKKVALKVDVLITIPVESVLCHHATYLQG